MLTNHVSNDSTGRAAQRPVYVPFSERAFEKFRPSTPYRERRGTRTARAWECIRQAGGTPAVDK